MDVKDFNYTDIELFTNYTNTCTLKKGTFFLAPGL